MRLAISAEENRGLESGISHHFGRCPYFVLVDVDDGVLGDPDVVENPYYAAHQPGMVPEFIHGLDVDVMLSGGMGRRAIAFFQDFGIDIATGGWGTVQQVIDDFLAGRLTGSDPCRESRRHDCGREH
jgi:predicted Fe-Mo cluster-binding NifX family protein